MDIISYEAAAKAAKAVKELTVKVDKVTAAAVVIDCGKANSQFDSTTLVIDGGTA